MSKQANALTLAVLLAASTGVFANPVKGPRLTLNGHANEVQNVCFSPDGKRLASAANREMKVWDLANGKEFRTPPLMGMGKVGPPFMHDARVYLSRDTRDSYPLGTVYSSSEVTNAPLAVRTFDDALRAVIELHDLPPPDDARTPSNGGCPVPPGRRVGEIRYSGPDDICPPYASATSQRNRSESREVIRRFRALSPADQQALIEFLKQL